MTKWGMGVILALVVITLGYAGLTKDREFAEDFMTAGIGGLGGYGIGYATGKQKSRQ